MRADAVSAVSPRRVQAFAASRRVSSPWWRTFNLFWANDLRDPGQLLRQLPRDQAQMAKYSPLAAIDATAQVPVRSRVALSSPVAKGLNTSPRTRQRRRCKRRAAGSH
jgi:hypothetical protein